MLTNEKIIEELQHINNYAASLMIDDKISKHTGQILNNAIQDYIFELQHPPKQYVIRFNTAHNNETDLVWRVFENDVEHRRRQGCRRPPPRTDVE